jgi:predicted RNase H-like nuclease (RuvC/YqgF family)
MGWLAGRDPAQMRMAEMSEQAELTLLRRKVETLETSIEKLKRDNAELKKSLEVLEASRAQALNHIDWAIDSLHNVLEQRG